MHENPMRQMGSAPSWLAEFCAESGPRYAQIADLLERAVSLGTLRPGDRLPSHRQLAKFLGVDLTTVTRGVNEAKRRQLVSARGTLGTYVSVPKVEFRPWIDLGMNIPPRPLGLDVESLLRDGMSQVMARVDVNQLMSYQVAGGSRADRVAGARWLTRMLGEENHGRLFVCPGAQAALSALIASITEHGGTILCDSLVYPGLLLLASRLGRRLEAVPSDGEGMRPDLLEAALRRHSSRVVYLNPTLQNPTGATMAYARRKEICAVAVRHRLEIIEDDPYWLYEDSPPPPLATIAPEHVHYVSTVAKYLSPGLRTAFVQLARTDLEEKFHSALSSLHLMAAPLMTAIVTQWIEDGTAWSFFQGVMAESLARQRLAHGILPRASRVGRGIHLWQQLPSEWSGSELAAAARTEGLLITSSDAFQVRAQSQDAVRISLGGSMGRTALEEALMRLAGLLGGRPPKSKTA